jgi:hypothetical protein
MTKTYFTFSRSNAAISAIGSGASAAASVT